LALTVLAGCAHMLTTAAPERRFYALTAQRPEALAPARDKSVLKVRPFQISPAYQGKDMVYRTGDVEYQADYYNVFFVQPGAAATQAAEEWIGRSGLFGNVVDSTSQVPDTHVLEGMVNALYGDFRDPKNPKAVIEAQFFLLKNKDEKYSVIFQKSYSKAVPFSADYKDATLLAKAYQTGLTEMLSELENDIRAARP
jgi:cholesterol transport system auxiliary component